MILRLTASCNNRCAFCLVDDEIAAHRFRPLGELITEIDRASPDELVDLFGGEPTIDPNFWPVLEHALSTGRTVTLATNCRLFSHAPSARRLARMGLNQILVRTSLLGDSAPLHDRLNGVKRGAFEQTIAGISNLSEAGFDVQTNIVILADNLDRLLATALAAIEAGSRQIKLSGLIRTSRVKHMIPDPSAVRRTLATVVPLLAALGVSVRLEKLTPCVAPQFLHLLQREADTASDISSWYSKTPKCGACAFVSACPGAECGALECFGDQWLRPFAEIPDAITATLDVAELDHWEGEAAVVRVRLPGDDSQLLDALSAVVRFQACHPDRYVMA